MSVRPRILEILAESKDAAADQALAAGLLDVPPDLQLDLVKILLERNNDAGLRALPACFDKLGDEAQKMIVTNTSRLFRALRASSHSSSIQTRLNTVQIIRRSGNLRLAYLAAHAVHDGSPQVRAEGAATLAHLTNNHCLDYAETTAALRDAEEPDGSLSQAVVQTLRILRDERQYLLAALGDALNTFESHHRPEVLEASMFLADELQDKLFKHGTITRGKLTHAMLDIFTNLPSPRLAPFAYVALCYPELRRHMVAAIAAHNDPGFFAQFIRYHWLARDPVIRKNLVAVRSVAWLSDGLEAVFSLPSDVTVLAPGWLLLLGLPADRKVALLSNFLLIDDAPTNRAAIWALVEMDTPAGTLALQTAADHDNPVVRTIAQRELRFRENRDSRSVVLPRMDRPHEWATLLGEAGVAEDFDDLWLHFERLHPIRARRAGHHAMKFVPGFATQVQVKLLSQQATDRLRALRLLVALNIAERFQKDVFNAANDSSTDVRAATMTALGQISEATSRRILERAINDDEATVQSCAIEALEAVGGGRHEELLMPKVESENPNVRAAAIRVLLKLRVTKAAQALVDMLNDTRANHRCSALWVVDQLKLGAMAPRITGIARSDPDSRIGKIAEHVAKRLRRANRPAANPATADPDADKTLEAAPS
ncbi:MAG: HEAT repeat domain-containing protein [Planctomycetota bacterium]